MDFGDHVVSIVGFDDRYPEPVFCIQNSHANDELVFCLTLAQWAIWRHHHCENYNTDINGPFTDVYECLEFYETTSSISYLVSVLPPIEYDPATDAPFDDWYNHAHWDKNADLLPDASQPDSDGDKSLNAFDCGPNNPLQQIDTDGDGHCEPRLSEFDAANCLAWCESLEALAGLTGSPEGGGYLCEYRCRDWDRCITTGIKNVYDVYAGNEQCTWGCLTEDTTTCDPHALPLDVSVSDCCQGSALNMLDQICRPLYKNTSNVDSNDDFSRIADVCEERVSTLPVIANDTVMYWMPASTPGGAIDIEHATFEHAYLCREPVVRAEIGFFGGTVWDTLGSLRYEITAVAPVQGVSEIGACTCPGNPGTWEDCESTLCREGQETPGLFSVWQDIDAIECSDLQDPVGTAPYNTLCDDKRTTHTRDEDCSDGVCDVRSYTWRWNDQPIIGSGDRFKIRVGVRAPGQSWMANEMFVSQSYLFAPSDLESCESPFNTSLGSQLDGWQHTIPRDGPNDPLGGYLGSQVFTRDTVTAELFAFEYDKQMRGPINLRRLSYAADSVPRVMDSSFVSVVAHVKSSLFGMAGTGTKSAFMFGRTDGACTAPPCGGTTESQLWVAGLVDGLDTISLASDIFGPSPDKPPIMDRPVAVFDQSLSRIIVAGGGESGKFGVWAYTPHIGRWHELATPLPPDLQGVAMVADRARHRLYLLGGRSGGEDLASLVVVNLLSGAAEAVTPPPSALARSYHAMAIDPFNRFLYVFGGSYGAGLLGDTWQYDLRTRVWTQVGDGTNPNGPGPRERAQMLFERRHGRLWVSGGWDAAGYVGPTLFGYSTAMNVWTHRTLAPERGPEGETRQGVFAPDTPVTWSMTVDERIPYPGQPYRLILGADDPCVGLMVSDEAGQPIVRSRHCAVGDRAVAFFGQPGERYLIELVALEGFELGQTSDYQLEFHEASLKRVGELVLPGTPIPRSVAGAGSSSGPVAFVLAGEDLVSVDLTSPDKPEVITSLGIEGGLPRDMLVSYGHALVSVDSAKESDSVQRLSTANPWEMKWLDSTDLPNDTGGLVALWRGRLAYLANGSMVDIVDLAAPDGPKYLRTLNVEEDVTCLRVHGDRLYLCTLDKRLTVYSLDWQGGEQKEQELDLTQIGQSIQVHGNTVHVGELDKEAYQSCISGGLCNTKGVVEVFRRGEAGFVWTAEYPLDEGALPYLVFTGSAALRINAGGFDVYDLGPLY